MKTCARDIPLFKDTVSLLEWLKDAAGYLNFYLMFLFTFNILHQLFIRFKRLLQATFEFQILYRARSTSAEVQAAAGLIFGYCDYLQV